MVERFWVEINSRVNYPIKQVIIAMQARDEIDLDSPIHTFCISWYTQRVAHVGTSMAVHSWNAHPIPGPHKGVPADRMCENDQTSKIPLPPLPTLADAVSQFEQLGGSLTPLPQFGEDPLHGKSELMDLRNAEFTRKYPDFNNIFHQLVYGDDTLFVNGLQYFISISIRLGSTA